MHTNEDIRPLHRVAVLASVDVVSLVTADDLALATPCAGWNLAESWGAPWGSEFELR